MADTEFRDDLIDLQREAHAAWNAVESRRKAVDARRRPAPYRHPENEPWRTPILPPSEEEDAKGDRLLATARQAQEALAAGIAAASLQRTYDVVHGLHKAAQVEE